MKKIITLSLGLALAFTFGNLSSVSASSPSAEASLFALSDSGTNAVKKKLKQEKRIIKQGKKIRKKVKKEVKRERRINRAIQKCIDNGNTQQTCETRAENVRKGLAKVRKEKRMNFVRMIIDGKKSCKAMHEGDRDAIRTCFREKVKTGVIAIIQSNRQFRKECREELDDDAMTSEVRLCAIKKQLGENTTSTSQDDNTEDDDADVSDDDDAGDDDADVSDDDSGDDSGDVNDDDSEDDDADVSDDDDAGDDDADVSDDDSGDDSGDVNS